VRKDITEEITPGEETEAEAEGALVVAVDEDEDEHEESWWKRRALGELKPCRILGASLRSFRVQHGLLVNLLGHGLDLEG
jgi:hypothetical protein